MLKKFKNRKKLMLFLIALVIIAIYLFPVFWVISTSFKSLNETITWPPTLIPNQLRWQNYTEVLESRAFMHLKNSLIIGVSVTFLTVFFAMLTGYALSRIKKKWINWLILLFLVGQMLPQILMVTPLFMIFDKMGLLNTYWAVILGKTGIALPLAVVFLRTTFLSIPESLEEAAWIDGCSRMGAFFRVVMPVAKTGILIIAAITFMFAWGDFIYSISFLSEMEMQPATVGLYTFIGAKVTKWNKVMAFTNVIILPVIILFITLQDKIIKGWTAGSFK